MTMQPYTTAQKILTMVSMATALYNLHATLITEVSCTVFTGLAMNTYYHKHIYTLSNNDQSVHF